MHTWSKAHYTCSKCGAVSYHDDTTPQEMVRLHGPSGNFFVDREPHTGFYVEGLFTCDEALVYRVINA